MLSLSKVLFIGIDAGDKDRILQWAMAGCFTNFSKLLRSSAWSVTQSPVDFYDGANRAIPMPACRPQSLADIGKSSCSQVAAILKGFFRMCPIGISVGTGYSKMLSADQDVFP